MSRLAPRVAVWLAVVAALVPAVADAQVPAQTGSVAGVVYDSLSGRPVPGAAVWSEQARRATVTDAAGHFVLDSLLPGEHRLVVADSQLDALGVNLTRTVRVAPGATQADAHLVLATPSLPTITRRLCEAGPNRMGDRSTQGGILFGAVRNVATGVRLAGAVVEIRWLRIEFLRGKIVPLVADAQARTDSLGSFVACGLPTDTVLQVTAHGGSHGISGDTELRLGERPIARVDLATSGRVAGDSTGALRGMITDTLGNAMAGVSVLVEGARDSHTGDDGRFFLDHLPAGTQTFTVRRPGFAPQRMLVDIAPNDTPVVRVAFRAVLLLPTVAVRSPRASRTMNQFEQRRRVGQGSYLTPADIANRPDIRSVFFGVKRIKVINVPGGFDLLGPPPRPGLPECPMTIFIDGYRATIEELRTYDPRDIQGVEVYPKADQAPLQFRGQVGGCGGAVVVWTRWL
jgi:hypothetical protein